MKKPPGKSPKKEEPTLTPGDFLSLVTLMPNKGAKGSSQEALADPAQPQWLPAKWKKGWFSIHLNRVIGKVEPEEAESVLEALLSREDGLEEYAQWLLTRLTRPRDSWSGFAQLFATHGFFDRVQAKNSGVYRKIARGGKESAAAEERINSRFRLLGSIAFSSGTGSELHVSDSYAFGRYALSSEARDWIANQQKPIRLLQKSARSTLTRRLLAQEFIKVAPDINQALVSLEEEVAEAIGRDIANAVAVERLQGEIEALKQEAEILDKESKSARQEVKKVTQEKHQIEDSGSDASRLLKDRFDGLRLNVADEIERLLKVAAEVARSVDDPKKKDILTRQIDQALIVGTELRDSAKATKRAGG